VPYCVLPTAALQRLRTRAAIHCISPGPGPGVLSSARRYYCRSMYACACAGLVSARARAVHNSGFGV
jgi:hypothetical protein